MTMRCRKTIISLLLLLCLICRIPAGRAQTLSGEDAKGTAGELTENLDPNAAADSDTDGNREALKAEVDEFMARFQAFAEAYPATEEEWEAWGEILDQVDVDKWLEYEQVGSPVQWLYCFRLPGNVYAIYELLHDQQAMAFLIPGEERALLLDTCVGLHNIREVAESLTDLPITVLNSHDHFDHIGGNALFEEVWCYNDPAAIAHLTAGPSERELQEIRNRTKYVRVILDFQGESVSESIPGKAPTGTVEDGQIIDLGGRKLEVIHTPGHQPSCIMLLDRENHLLFTGDMFYPGPMYCMFSDSSFPDYVKSIRKAVNTAEENGVEQVYTSHNLPTASTEDLRRYADFLERIEAGEITDYQIEDGYPVYAMDEVYSISVVGEGQEPMVLFDGADGK